MRKTKVPKAWKGISIMTAGLLLSLSMQPVYGKDYSVTPVVNSEATRGLSTVSSAEPMGAGRLTFSLGGNWYKQNRAFVSSPNKNANIINGLGAASYGANSNIDLFASVGAFGSSNYTNTSKSGGWGSVKAGVQGTLPYAENSMLNLGAQLALLGGTSNNQINSYRSDGYNYFQTRTGTDLMAKLLQTLSFGNESHAVKLHLNEGAVRSLNGGDASLLLLGAGLQGNLFSFAAIGLELNSRTQLNKWAFRTDPLWFTPSVQFRSSYNTNVSAGVDISLSKNRANGEPRALEPYRVFGAVAFSFDMFADRRRAELLQKQRAAHVERQNIALVREQEANQQIADSLARKAQEDSIALVVAAQQLEAEKAARTEEEKTLLSTGLLTLDTVYFEIGKSEIDINSKPFLGLLAKMLQKYPKLQLEVAGHSDNKGSKSKNITLAQSRADAVRNYLIEAVPELAPRLTARGYGDAVSKGSNQTVQGRRVNRRVEIVVLNKDVLSLEYPQTSGGTR